MAIEHRLAMPYTPEQNGSAERENRTLLEVARSMLAAKEVTGRSNIDSIVCLKLNW